MKVARYIIAGVLFLICAIILVMISTQRMGFYLVPTSSMEPTLYPDDRLMAYDNGNNRRGDIIVIRDPDDPRSYLVKRIVALPGDLVEIAGGRLYVNGVRVDEPYLAETMEYGFGPYNVKQDEYFVLGDNRNESEDSHIWSRGAPRKDVMGRARYIYSPGSRRGPIELARTPFARVPDSR